MIVVRDQYGQTDLKSPRYSAFKIFDARSLTVPDTIGVLPTLQSTKFLWVTQVVITT